MLGKYYKKNCYYCKFCYKEKKPISEEAKKELGSLAEPSPNEPTKSDLTEEDLSDMYGLRQEYKIKCFKEQWDEDLHPELKTQSLKKRTCKYFLNRKKNLVKSYEQLAREQIEQMGVQRHRQTIEWMQISFLVGVTSVAIAVLSRVPNIGEKLMGVISMIKGFFSK